MVSYVWGYWSGTAATTTAVWNNWTTANTTATANVWPYWISSGATTATTWINWNDGIGTLVPTPIRPRQLTPEELDAHRIARAQAEERQALARADREQAVQRAETLLHENLNDRQRRSLRAHGRFRVKAASGRWYEVWRNHHGRLIELGARGKPVNNLCVYATGGAPDADQMLAQKLYLEAAEETLRRVAHITPVAA